MKNLTLIVLGTLCLSSCYTYQVYDPEKDVETNQLQLNGPKLPSVRSNNVPVVSNQNIDKVTNPEDIRPKSIIKAKEFYQVKVLGKETKIEAVKWEGDSLVANIKGQPNKILKLHENDIEDLKVRKFSKGRSDALTIAGYAVAGVGVFLLLK